jgi:hypothetical protein
VLIDEAGVVRDLEIQESSGSAEVDAAAREFLASQPYRPAWRDGEPIAVWLDSVTVWWPLIVLNGEPRPDIWWGPGEEPDWSEYKSIEVTWPGGDIAAWAGVKVIDLTTHDEKP